MFEPHEDPRTEQVPSKTPGSLGFVLGFVIGFGVGWLLWDKVVLPALRSTPTADNPTGDPTGWIYYGSLALCVAVSLFVVSVIGEWLGSRRLKAARG